MFRGKLKKGTGNHSKKKHKYYCQIRTDGILTCFFQCVGSFYCYCELEENCNTKEPFAKWGLIYFDHLQNEGRTLCKTKGVMHLRHIQIFCKDIQVFKKNGT